MTLPSCLLPFSYLVTNKEEIHFKSGIETREKAEILSKYIYEYTYVCTLANMVWPQIL